MEKNVTNKTQCFMNLTAPAISCVITSIFHLAHVKHRQAVVQVSS